MYPIYRDIPNWVILDEVLIQDFGESPREIPVVNVLIGTLHRTREGLDGKPEQIRTPITRWMTKFDFINLNKEII